MVHIIWSIRYASNDMLQDIWLFGFESTTKIPPARVELFYEIRMFISPWCDIHCPPVRPVCRTSGILHHVIRIMSSNDSIFIQGIFLTTSIPIYWSANIKCIWIWIHLVIRIWRNVKWITKIIRTLRFRIESARKSNILSVIRWKSEQFLISERDIF